MNWNGKIIAKKSLDNKNYPSINGKYFSRYLIEKGEAKPIEGHQLKYIYLIDKTCKITVPILPFSKIDEMGAGMYKGEKITLQERKVINLSGEVDSNSNS